MRHRAMLTAIVLACSAPVALSGAAMAQSSGSTGSSSSSATSTSSKAMSTAEYMKQAAAGGAFALKSSQLAEDKAQSEMVKSFAESEVIEQQNLMKVMQMASGDKPDTDLTEDKQAMLKKLQQADGAAFDRMYLQGQMMGHQELLQIHQSYAENGDDDKARIIAMMATSNIQQHLNALESMAQQIDPEVATGSKNR